MTIYEPHDCKICGKHEENRWCKEKRDQLTKHQLCSHCDFWMEKVENRDMFTIIDGKSYKINSESLHPAAFRGFGGTKFKIRKLKTGKIIETTNLWHQGTVPERFREQLQDDAEFVEEEGDGIQCIV